MTQYPWLLLAVYVVTVGGVQLLALWAAASRLPWLLRAVAVWVPIALLAAIRAYEPAIVLLVSAALTIGLSRLLARFSSYRDPAESRPPPWWRFRLADLLVLILFLGTWLGLTTRGAPAPDQFYLLVLGHCYLLLLALAAAVPFALLAVLAHRIALGPRRGRAILLALCVVWLTSLLWRWLNVPLYLGAGQPSLGPNWTRETASYIGSLGGLMTGVAVCLGMPFGVWTATKAWHATDRRRALVVSTAVALACGVPLGWLARDYFRGQEWVTLGLWGLELAIHAVFPIALTAFLAVVTWLCSVGWGQTAGRKSRLARGTVFLLALACALPGAWIYWQMLWYAPYPKVNAGPENYYDRLVAIAKHMNPYVYTQGDKLPPAVAAELDEAVLLLREHNEVPQHVIESRSNSDTGLTGRDLGAMTVQLRQAADNAAKARDFDRAATYGVAIIRFDAMAGQGEQAGFAQQGYALLVQYRREFSPAKARDVIRLLRQTLAERNDISFLIACYRAQWERQAGWHPKLRSALARLCGKPPYNSSAEAAGIREGRQLSDTLNLLLQTDLAIGVFQSDHGRLPASLAELVPEYLPEVPSDPYSGVPLVYRPVPTQLILYSIGPDGTDDGGRVPSTTGPIAQTHYDIRLEPTRAGKK